MKRTTLFKSVLLLCALIVGSGSVWATEITYIFTSKSWGAEVSGSVANWTSGKDGNQLTADQGIQVTTGVSGANGTSPVSFNKVSKVVIRYCTNATKGVGTIKVKIGSGTEKSFSVTKPSSGGTTLKDAEFTFSPAETGSIKITADCTTNSVYIYGVTITYIGEPSTPDVDGSGNVTLTTTTNMAGWRTYNNNTANKYTVDGTTKVYYASAASSGTNKVTLEEIAGGVPANTVVILHQSSGTTINLTKNNSADITAPGSNKLLVTTSVTDLSAGVYRLGYKTSNGVGFYKYANASAPVGIIYLTLDSPANFLDIDFDESGDVTKINELRGQKTVNGEYFNLAGQRVAQPTKGLYLVNGKKVVIK